MELLKKYKTIEQINEEFREALQHSYNQVCLVGTEATIRPDFINTARMAGEVGFKITEAMTNDRKISDTNFAKEVASSGSRNITISISGGTKKLVILLQNQMTASVEALRVYKILIL